MKDENIALIKSRVADELINPELFKLENEGQRALEKQIMFDQYKLLVDSAHRGEERRSMSNNVFLGVNSLIASFLVKPISEIFNIKNQDLPISILFSLVGILVAFEWLKVNSSYKKLNFINFEMIDNFELLLPSRVFSLRAKLDSNPHKRLSSDAGNNVLIKENFLPIAFILLYSAYLITLLVNASIT